jgi:hypothetical protein
MYVETKKLFELNGFSEKFNYSKKILVWWWALFITHGVLPLLILIIPSSTESDNIAITAYDIIASPIQVILFTINIFLPLITIKVIKDYSKIEPLLAEINSEEPQVPVYSG